MPFAENLKRTIYIAHRSVNENGVSVYDEPVEYRVSCNNVLPTTTSADLTKVGTSYFERLYVVGEPEYLADVKQLDKVYVYAELPEQPDPLARTADFFVKGILDFPMCTRMILQQITSNEV